MLYSESQLRRVILLVSRLFSTAVYPACDPLTTALSLFQVPDLFAQSDLSWSLLLGDLSRSAGVWGVAPAVPSLHEAFQSWCRLFSTAYWKSQERFYSSFVVPCENNTSHALSTWHGLSLPLAFFSGRVTALSLKSNCVSCCHRRAGRSCCCPKTSARLLLQPLSHCKIVKTVLLHRLLVTVTATS